MTSMRKFVREQCQTILIAGATAAGSRIFTSRVFPIWKLTFPVVAVYTTGEDVTIKGQFPTTTERKIRVAVQIIDGNVDTDVEDRMDDLAEEIESILDADDNWETSLISRTEYTGTEIELVTDREQDRNYATATLNFDVYYNFEVVPVAKPDLAYVEIEENWIPEQPPDPPT